MDANKSYCGCIAIVGRPNVGKSTLLNHILEQKLSITCRKPQTTRHNITGVKTLGNVQMVFVDTPGMHLKEPRAINRYMNKAATSATKGVDVALFVVDRNHWNDEDEMVFDKLQSLSNKTIVVINKVDQNSDKSELMDHAQRLLERMPNAEIVPVSALKNQNLDQLEGAIIKRLPEGTHLFPDDQITDKSSRFVASELVREKIMRQLGDELPYQMTVEIEEFSSEGKVLHISALILVERESQKKILIGRKGERLKLIGTAAREDMEQMFDIQVNLKLWVKVRSGWSDDERALRSLGYEDL